jgi:hypothetical protein
MAITVSQITSADKSGIFDVLMAQINAQLNEQFQAKRISGKEYAEVYLGALTSVLGQSVQYVTSVQTADAQVALINAQKLQVEAETQKAVLEKTVIEKQILKLEKDILIADKQLEILAEQLIKSGMETDLINAKVKTEEAQYKDTVDGVAVAGIIGKQKELYAKQSEGFLRDAEQKLLKIMSDIWAIQKSTSPNDIIVNQTGLHDNNIRVVAIKAIEGIGGIPLNAPT